MDVEALSQDPVDGDLVGPAYKKMPDGFPAPNSYFATKQELHAVLAATFGAPCLRPYADFDDEAYYLAPREVVDAIFEARSSKANKVQKWRQIFDCEDFAYSLKADFALHRFRHATDDDYVPFAIGILWGGPPEARHAVNVVVTCDGQRLDVLIADTTPDSTGVYPASEWDGGVDYIVI